MQRGITFLLAATALAAFAVESSAGVAPATDEFLVNASTAGSQYTPAVARLPAGGFLVVWEDSQPGATRSDVFGQRFDAGGNLVGTEFQVNSITVGYQSDEHVTTASDGAFLVVWRNGDAGGLDTNVLGRRFDSDAMPLGSEFAVNSYLPGFQQAPAAAMTPDNGFVVTWDSDQLGEETEVFGQRFDPSGVAIGSEFLVNTTTLGAQQDSDVAVHADGSFVVVWSNQAASPDSDVFGQRFATDGSPVGTEFRVNTYTTGQQLGAHVAAGVGGEFVVVWSSAGQDGSQYGVFGQRFSGAGSPTGSEFQVNSYTTGDQGAPDAGVDVEADPATGGFVATWTSQGQDGADAGVFGQHFDRDGPALGSEFLVNQSTQNGQLAPSLVFTAPGGFVVSWDTDTGSSSAFDVGARLFAVVTTTTSTTTTTTVSTTTTTLPVTTTTTTVPTSTTTLPGPTTTTTTISTSTTTTTVSTTTTTLPATTTTTFTTLSTTTTTVPPTTTTVSSTTTTSLPLPTTTLPTTFACGDANGDQRLSASDALIALRTGVGSDNCLACVCDVDASGTINATDALGILRVAVGQPVVLGCLPCA